MKPTMKLRWKRTYSLYKGDPDIQNAYGTHHVLQQWWAVWREGQETPTGEWRDIPIEAEE